MALSPLLQPVGFGALPGWAEDDGLDAAFAAFARSARRALEKPYRSGDLGIASSAFAPAFTEARAGIGPGAARAFFERHFVPVHVAPEGQERGLVTGFYEPVVAASRARSQRFSVPLYRRPDDLVDVDDSNRPEGFDSYPAFAKDTGRGLVEYPDRAAIEAGALAGRGLEIAWLEDPVDAYFIHVQGAARLNFPDGATMRVTYAAKSGQRFTGAGHVLIELGEMRREDVTMQSIRAWLAAHPGRIAEILQRNRSFIFFREAPVEDAALGPVAAAKVPLTPGRSIAVDRLRHTFATPLFIDAPALTAFEAQPFRRLMIAQDTGSAIVGAARGDLFAGSGDAAGEVAGVVRHEADFYAMVPKALLS